MIEWEFLFIILSKFGFGQGFLSCVSSFYPIDDMSAYLPLQIKHTRPFFIGVSCERLKQDIKHHRICSILFSKNFGQNMHMAARITGLYSSFLKNSHISRNGWNFSLESCI